MNLGDALLAWYREEGRELPWRQDITPYKVWLSEIIMQQTRVAQGLPYFEKFYKELPTVKDFAEADQDRILNLWQGLGYYSRARNMHFAANQVMEEFEGVFPSKYEELKGLKGVGDYTAAAISSIAFGERKAVVDGNVYRVLSRVFDIDLPIDATLGKKYFQELADELIHHDHPGDYNQAIMDFGAMVCTPQNPDCVNCPLMENCLGLSKGTISQRPVKTKKVKVSDRFFDYFEICYKNFVAIEQRKGNDIWKGLYQLPLVEVSSDMQKSPSNISSLVGFNDLEVIVMGDQKHILSHQRLHASFYKAEIPDRQLLPEKFIWVKRSELDNYAFPKLISNYLKD